MLLSVPYLALASSTQDYSDKLFPEACERTRVLFPLLESWQQAEWFASHGTNWQITPGQAGAAQRRKVLAYMLLVGLATMGLPFFSSEVAMPKHVFYT